MRAPNRVGRGFGQSQVAHFSRPDQFAHCADCFFNRNRRIDAMLIIQVDMIGLQAFQTGVATSAHIFRPAIHADKTAVGAAFVAEFGGENDFVAASGNRAPNQFLVGERAIHIGGVEKVKPQFQRAMNGRNRFVFVAFAVIALAVKIRHSHAAQAQRGNFQTLRT